MSKHPFPIAILLLLVCALGCGRPNGLDRVSNGDTLDPIQAAFNQQELGKPVDWESLSEADKAFLSALQDRDAVKARTALAAGANANMDCGHGCTVLMLAAATGDTELVAAVKKADARETPDAEPYLEVLEFAKNAERSEYKAALKEIANLTGKAPTPLERAGLYQFALNTEAAKAFLSRHHARLLHDGCYVFLHEQHFGIDGQPDVLWVLPTKDKFAVMAFTGVDAINYDIENHLVIRWMKRLEKDQPFLLTGCGQDFLSGCFIAKLKDGDTMARRMHAFCPDIVHQGIGSVEALASELRRTNEFCFWWD